MKIIKVLNSVVIDIIPDTDENYDEAKYSGSEIEDSVSVSVGDFWDPAADPAFTPLTKEQTLSWNLKPTNLTWGKFTGRIDKDTYTSIVSTGSLAATVEVDKVHGVEYSSTSYIDAGIFTEDEWDTVFEYEPFTTGSL